MIYEPVNLSARAGEEKKIRTNPAARGTDLLKTVLGR